MPKKSRLIALFCSFFFAEMLNGCGGEPKSGDAAIKTHNTAAPATSAAASAAVIEAPMPAIAVKRPDEIPIKLRRPDTAKMAAALRMIESARAAKTPAGGLSPFVGKWTLDKNVPGASFEVNISQWKDELRGSYCATAENGAKKDCVTNEGEQYPAFRAPAPAGASLEAEFTTYRENDKGQIRLSLENGKLHWTITRQPKTECDAPKEARLKRKK